MRKSVTIQDVAKQCNVSLSTASYALNKVATSKISDSKRETILSVAKEMGYRPNLVARSMITKKYMRIGVMFYSLADRSFSLLLEEIQEYLAELGYIGVFGSWGSTYEREPFLKVYDSIVQGGVDGMIIGHSETQFFDKRIPTVLYGDCSEKEYDLLNRPYLNILKHATTYLKTLGHSKIAFMQKALGSDTNELKLMRTLLDVCPDEYLLGYGDHISNGSEMLKHLLAIPSKKRPTAVITAGDAVATGMMQEAARRGMKIPDELSIMGCTNLPESGYMHPSLTTFLYDRREVARTLVDKLMNRMKHPETPIEHKYLKTEIIERESCARLK